MIHQKTTQSAIAAVSRLAELYADPDRTASSAEIAQSRGQPKPLVAKILTNLARAGIVKGSPGPGGGYRLAREPRQISLKDVAVLFERVDENACPYGPGWCGNEDPCPLHESIVALKSINDDFLKRTTFDVFVGHSRPDQSPSS